MKKRTIIFIAMLIISTAIFAKHSDVYMIGDYSKSIKDGDIQVLQFLQDAHFNYMRQNIDEDDGEAEILDLLQTFDEHQMDVRFRDVFEENGVLGTQLLTRANYWLFEAKFILQDFIVFLIKE